MVQYYTANLKHDRLPCSIYEYHIANGSVSWAKDLKLIATILLLQPPDLGLEYDVNAEEASILKLSQDQWWEEAIKISKLRSFAKLKDMETPNILVKGNLRRSGRSLLEYPTSGNWNGDTKGFARLAINKKFEEEFHNLFSCPISQTVRSQFYADHIAEIGQFLLLSDEDMVTWIMSEENIKANSTYPV